MKLITNTKLHTELIKWNNGDPSMIVPSQLYDPRNILKEAREYEEGIYKCSDEAAKFRSKWAIDAYCKTPEAAVINLKSISDRKKQGRRDGSVESTDLFSAQMTETLNALRSFLEDHNAYIIRSATTRGELALQIKRGDAFEEVTFREDIGPDAIKWGWYSPENA